MISNILVWLVMLAAPVIAQKVHDHKGKWTDGQTIKFEALRAGMMGQLVTETNRWYFPDANTIDKTSAVTLADGSSMNFEFKAKRSRGSPLKVDAK